MLKISESTDSLTWPGKGRVGVDDNNKARRDGSELDRSKVDGNGVGDDKVGKKFQKSSKFKK